jgi:16S rRNA (adenine1518-N6/adenine1519-N6)-dimethyltransferase
MQQSPQWEDPRKVLARYQLAPKKRYSQNFLVSRFAVDAIAKAAVDPSLIPVVELGAGLGTLTAALLRVGARVYAVERDDDLVALLKDEFSAFPEVRVIAADAVNVDLRAIVESEGRRVAVAGNIPYAITGAIIKHLIASKQSLVQAVLMVQREVRDRLQAAPGTKAYGALSVFTSAAFKIDTLIQVSAGSFFPRPKVDSSVVRLLPHAVARAEETDSLRFLVHAAFQQRRKTLRNALRHAALETETSRVDDALGQSSIDGGRRGETLSVEEFARLANVWEQLGSV